MRQFDVFINPSARSNERAPFLLVLPFRYFLDRGTTLIAPLIKEGLFKPIPRLNPVFEFQGRSLVLSPLEIVNIPTAELRELVGNIEADRSAIIGALDLLFTGV